MPSKPKLGQNFLTDPSAAMAIVGALGDISSATVVEIGPGKGAVTTLLAPRAGRLIAVELDPALAAQLRRQYVSHPSVEVLEQDILATNLAEVLHSAGEQSEQQEKLAERQEKLDEQTDETLAKKLVVVGNLPYYITSPILLHLFAHHREIDFAVLMVQREVAERIAAQPGSRDYGLLTATTQLYAQVENLLTLPPSAFSPPPEVFSTLLRLRFLPRLSSLGVDPKEFIPFLKQCFAQKRKTLANNLRFAGFKPEEITRGFTSAHIPTAIRAEALPLESAANLFHALKKKSNP